MGRAFVCFVSLLLTGAPVVAHAQTVDTIGVRAQGMGGAFTAVSDDATATWWNPAGLAGGAYLNMVLEYGEPTDSPLQETPSHRGIALAFPALGLSYYHLTIAKFQPASSTATSGGVRQDPGTPFVRALEVSQFGATVGQSIGNHLVVASTAKVVHGEGDSDGGLDIGVMAKYQTLKAGLSVRNVTEPTLGEGDLAFTLKRQARAGVSWAAGAAGTGMLTVAFDADILKVDTLLGEERRYAVGGEYWTRRRAIAARGGISWSAVGDHRTSYAGGVSLAIHNGVYGEAELTGGNELRKGWNVGARVTF